MAAMLPGRARRVHANHRIANHRIANHRIANHRIANHRIGRAAAWPLPNARNAAHRHAAAKIDRHIASRLAAAIRGTSDRRIRRCEARNKALAQARFERRKSRSGSPFERLVSAATWTIVAPSLRSETDPLRQAFRDAAIGPPDARMATRLVPTVRGIDADGDMLIIRFDAAVAAARRFRCGVRRAACRADRHGVAASPAA